MPADSATMEAIATGFAWPMTLLINFSLFQYLFTFYNTRRRELRGAILLLSAFGGFVTLVPFALVNDMILDHLNIVSEILSVITFLIQIVIVGRDVNKKVRIRSLKWVSIVGEVLTLVGLAIVVYNLALVTAPDDTFSTIKQIDNVYEMVALWFIFFSRFYYIIMSRGWRDTLKTKKLELVLYILFTTHEYPFHLLETLTHVSWESEQALWNRLTIMMCVLATIHAKYRSQSSKQSKMNTTKGPNDKSVFVPEQLPAKRRTSHTVTGTTSRTFVRTTMQSLRAIVPVKT